MNRTAKAHLPSEYIGKPCGCDECKLHGVENEPQRKVPGFDGVPVWLHGVRLRQWIDARKHAQGLWRKITPKGMA